MSAVRITTLFTLLDGALVQVRLLVSYISMCKRSTQYGANFCVFVQPAKIRPAHRVIYGALYLCSHKMQDKCEIH